MAVSFGIAKKIIDHPSYNFGLALPFVCAFYALNANDPYIIPIIGFPLNHGISAASSPDAAQRNPGAAQTQTVLFMWFSIDIIMTLDWN